jgi:hypothetical protein
MRAMTCPHRPVSNGVSFSTSSHPVTWCGRCAQVVALDADWIHEIYDRKARRIRDRMETSIAEVETERRSALDALGERA